MNLDQLRGFETIARLGHFTRAAELLHLAQPSLSRQISTLESDLGTKLFHRTRGGATLTDAGEALLPLARRMLADAESVRLEMAELAGLRRGRVRLGATPTLCVSLVAEVLSAFHERHPGVELHIVESGSRGLVDALDEGALDLALVVTAQRARPGSAALERRELLAEELVVVSSAARQPLVEGPPDQAAVTLAELAELPQVAFHSSYDLRATTDAAFRAAGLVPSIAVEGAEMDGVLRFVERGIGVAVVPAMVLLERPMLRSTRLVAPQLARGVSLARRSDVALTRATAAMERVIVDTAERLTSPGEALAHLVTRPAGWRSPLGREPGRG